MTPRVMDPKALSVFYLLKELRERDIDPLPEPTSLVSSSQV